MRKKNLQIRMHFALLHFPTKVLTNRVYAALQTIVQKVQSATNK